MSPAPLGPPPGDPAGNAGPEEDAPGPAAGQAADLAAPYSGYGLAMVQRAVPLFCTKINNPAVRAFVEAHGAGPYSFAEFGLVLGLCSPGDLCTVGY